MIYFPETTKKTNLFLKSTDGNGFLIKMALGKPVKLTDDFEKLAGRVWDPQLRGHDPHGKFRVDVDASDHAIAREHRS